MPEEFEGDFAGAVFWGADLSGSIFRDVDLTGAKISHAWFVNVTVDALIDNVVINGVDVTGYVNERDPWFPLRAMLRPTERDDLLAACDALDQKWAEVIARVQQLDESAAHRSVNDEFSFVQTVRHLIFAMDKWFSAPVLDGEFDPIGMPNSGSVDFPWPGLDHALEPSLSDALSVRAQRAAEFRTFLASVSASDLTREIEILENGPHTLGDCLHTVFEEEFWHLRYAHRDLAALEAAG